MKINGQPYRTIWLNADGWSATVIDQTKLPFTLETKSLTSMADAANAIKQMIVRGAPLIGVTAAYGVCLQMRQDAGDDALEAAYHTLMETRPTAVNLRWALDEMMAALRNIPRADRVRVAYARAGQMAEDDVETNRRIGIAGLALIEDAAKKRGGQTVRVLTHCNAGWLGCVDWGTALSPLYMAHDKGIPLHVWVDETRPRNQGAALTAFELGGHGVPHAILVDNAGGHYMQHGEVDLCIVGADRVTAAGDACNKIGTYLKALAAHDNDVPFYVAVPSSTIDWTMSDGVKEIPIEERSPHEVTDMTGVTKDGRIETIRVANPGSAARNPGFDVTPARLVTKLITERGVADASRHGLLELFPERKA
jgi:methylthioribose-1-phosphate isomerase